MIHDFSRTDTAILVSCGLYHTSIVGFSHTGTVILNRTDCKEATESSLSCSPFISKKL